jgi:hypothetical protein
MGNYHKLESMLEEELDKITAQGKLGTSALEVGDKVAHFLKSLKTIDAMDGESYDDYSNDYMPMNSNNNSYARGRGTYAKRDSMGRYSSRYSGNDKQSLMKDIEMLKDRLEDME